MLILLLLSTTTPVISQSIDTLLHEIKPIDSIFFEQIGDLDSIQKEAEAQFQNIKKEYDSISLTCSNLTGKIQNQVDSLSNIGQPFEKLTSSIDSINRIKEEKLYTLKQKAEGIKQKVNEKINSLQFPEEVSNEVSRYTAALDQLDLSLPVTDFNIPELNLGQVSNISLPNVGNPIPGDLIKLKIPEFNTNLSDLTDKLSAIQQELPETPSMEDVAAKAEEKAIEIVSEKMGDVSGVPELPASEEQAKQMLITEARKQAIDHFAGKQDKLQAAMDQMSKYKKRYSDVQSLKDLPKKAPNPMKGKPLIERLVPGITLQIQQRNEWWVDFNPYLGYRFNKRLTSGLGWNHRLAYNSDMGQFNTISNVYGPRAYGEYRLNKGIVPRVELECLNAPVRNLPDFTYRYREWVWSVMAGIKKDYRISKSIRGNAQVLYNIYDPDYKSPYVDRWNFRMGFEIQLKKKSKN